ncbi:membrane protein [Lactobacillus delbrueckii]|uniref:BMP family lipoprotein n=1 Tax=Lactobacillus delbrueckii TaxID=1584 RepID=UPI001F286D08|nr:BMP family protein [Lactobacillus delbrueckii]GHN50019.1 membrane protein [Lactobacillus delbrueckii]
MKKFKFKQVLATGTVLAAGIALTACSGAKQNGGGSNKKSSASVALITDIAGVDDHSFNQSGWEGMVAYGKSQGLKRGTNGYQYFESSSASDFTPNINQAVAAGYKTIFGVGYSLKGAIASAAKKHTDKNFVIIDDVIKGQKNVASANFKSQDASYMAGVVAARTTKTNVVGFIGGVHGDIVDLFDAGFAKGAQDTAKKMGKKITILNQYVGSFTAADKEKSIAKAMFAKKADVIFHASGSAGQGLFSEAKAVNEGLAAKAVNEGLAANSSKKVWVIGVDSDQSSLGKYKSKDGKKSNLCLTSVMTGVNVAVKDIATKAAKGKFPGGKQLVYGLKHNGVYLTRGYVADSVWEQAQTARSQILAGKISVPSHPSK